MLCTVIWDTYAKDEAGEVQVALETLLPPDGPDWSRKGLYGYWDPAERALLYLGLASDLPVRFAQHNGLVSHSGGNKREVIDEWFEEHPRLGLTVMVQAAAVQILEQINDLSPTLGVQTGNIIKFAEGQLIELHRLQTGGRPPWNAVGGSTKGRDSAVAGGDGQSFIPILAAGRDSMFVARRSLRDLVQDKQAQRWEAAIHAGRMRAVMEAHDIRGLPDDVSDVTARIQQLLLIRSGHLVDDVAPSDARVIEWLRCIEDGRAEIEVGDLRERIAAFVPTPELPGDRRAAAFLDDVMKSATFTEIVPDVAALFEAGYLASKPLSDGLGPREDRP